MNERIRELAEQAGVDFGSVTQDYFGEWVPAITSTEKIDFEKFAELIVRECAEIALEQKKWVEDMKVHNPHDEVWNKARIQQSQHIVDKIKEHFGVTE
jgi:hypothetical protein